MLSQFSPLLILLLVPVAVIVLLDTRTFKNLLLPEPEEIAVLIAESLAKKDLPGSVHGNLTYRQVFTRKMTLDLYEPLTGNQDGSAPLVVFFHGGSWLYGDKSTIRIIDRFHMRMRKDGYFVASVNYTGSVAGGLEHPEKNALSAVKWLLKKGSVYGYDSSNIALYGVSAGGHLALMTEAAMRRENAVSMVFAECAPVDLVSMAAGDAFESSAKLKLLPDAYLRRHSPVLRVASDMAPVLIFHGDGDEVVHVNQAYALHKAIADAGGYSELEIYEEGSHAFLGMPDSLWFEQETRALEFFRKYLKADSRRTG